MGRDLGVTFGRAVGVAVAVDVGEGEGVVVTVAVGVGAPASPQYLPPVSKSSKLLLRLPPQAIISLPVHTAVWEERAAGALVVLVAVQLSMPGLYLPPVLKMLLIPTPPQTIIWLPVHTAV